MSRKTDKTAIVWAMRTDDCEYPLEIGFDKHRVVGRTDLVLCDKAMRRLGLSHLPIDVPTKVRITVEVVK